MTISSPTGKRNTARRNHRHGIRRQGHFTFEGRAGDIIRAVLTPQASSSGFGGWWYQPEILLLDENEDLLAELHSYESVVLIQQLEETGEYHIIATGWGGRSADNVGKFGLLLEQVPILLDGEVVEGEASRQRGRHYAVQADKDFEIAYDHIGGAFFPTISVNVLAEDPYHIGGAFFPTISMRTRCHVLQQ